MEFTEKYDIAWKIFIYNQDMVKFADSKVKFLLAISGISTTVIISFMDKDIYQNPWAYSFLVLFFIFFVAFLYFSLKTIYPRPKYEFHTAVPELIFFNHIAARQNSKQFVTDFLECNETNRLEDLLQEIYQVSKIARLKFKFYDMAWKTLICQIISFLVLLAIDYSNI